MASRRPNVQGDRTVWRSIREGVAGGVDAGLADGLADGLRRHLPGGVAILVKGTPLCMLCAFVHFVLDVALPATAIAALLWACIGGIPTLVRAFRPTDSDSRTLDASIADKPPLRRPAA
jgi:hypothetical protein